MTLKSNVTGLVKLLLPDLTAVVFGKQISNSPDLPYATFDFVSNTKLGRAMKSTEDSTANPSTAITEVTETQRQTNIDLTFYTKTKSALLEDQSAGVVIVDKEAYDFSEEFTDKLESSDSLLYMEENGFSILNYTDFQDVDQFLSDEWERRATLELQVSYVSSVTKDIPFIGNLDSNGDPASVTGTYVNPDGTEL
jgi:hypothetical protein